MADGTGEILWSQLDRETQIQWAADFDRLARDCMRAASREQDIQHTRMAPHSQASDRIYANQQASTIRQPEHVIDLTDDGSKQVNTTPSTPADVRCWGGMQRNRSYSGFNPTSHNHPAVASTLPFSHPGASQSPNTPSTHSVASPIMHAPLQQRYQLPHVHMTKPHNQGHHEMGHVRQPSDRPLQQPSQQYGRPTTEFAGGTHQEHQITNSRVQQPARPQLRTTNVNGPSYLPAQDVSTHVQTYMSPQRLTLQATYPRDGPHIGYIPNNPVAFVYQAQQGGQFHHPTPTHQNWHPAQVLSQPAQPAATARSRQQTPFPTACGAVMQHPASPLGLDVRSQQRAMPPLDSPQPRGQPQGILRSDDPNVRAAFDGIQHNRTQVEAQSAYRRQSLPPTGPALTTSTAQLSKKRGISDVEAPTETSVPAKTPRVVTPVRVERTHLEPVPELLKNRPTPSLDAPPKVFSPVGLPCPMPARIPQMPQANQDSKLNPERHASNPDMEQLDKWCKKSRIHGLLKGEEWAYTLGNSRAEKPHYHFGHDVRRCSGCRQLGITNPHVLQKVHDRHQGSGGF